MDCWNGLIVVYVSKNKLVASRVVETYMRMPSSFWIPMQSSSAAPRDYVPAQFASWIIWLVYPRICRLSPFRFLARGSDEGKQPQRGRVASQANKAKAGTEELKA